ncbi:hypothetical protein DPMN_182326 [Dreissena polymorpha]|uniref:Uncharacterized protein n=1 Tax=Dreissena polymorpha TaxID=45954 RepID=A0A9D4DF92_DREPO|nr:hypothetical protein DPMN_182326 [Dreissena polymorpha]
MDTSGDLQGLYLLENPIKLLVHNLFRLAIAVVVNGDSYSDSAVLVKLLDRSASKYMS